MGGANANTVETAVKFKEHTITVTAIVLDRRGWRFNQFIACRSDYYYSYSPHRFDTYAVRNAAQIMQLDENS